MDRVVLHMDLDSYEVHEQEDIKSWLSCSQEMQPDAIEAVRRLSYDGATVKKCVRYPAPPSPPRAFATLPPGTGPTSWWVEPCNPATTAALSPGRRSSIPLPRSHREMPAAKPRQDTFWTELPQSPRCPSYPCTPNSKPQQRSPSRPMVAEMAKRRQPSQIRRQGPEGDSSAMDCVGDFGSIRKLAVGKTSNLSPLLRSVLEIVFAPAQTGTFFDWVQNSRRWIPIISRR